ncbi:phage portal protein [Lysinibacillus halotolerans]
MNEYIAYIDENGMNPKLLQQIIDETRIDRERRLQMYNRYKAQEDAVPILTRKPIDFDTPTNSTIKRLDDKVNNRLNNAFDAEIVDTKIGYMFGNPISYVVDKRNEKQLEMLYDAMEKFNTRNTIDDKDSENGKKAAICGYSARLLYINLDGQESIMQIDPWETIILTNTDVSEPTYGIHYFTTSRINEDGEKVKIEEAVFYDAKIAHHYRKISEDGEFELWEEKTKPHLFDYCPLFGIPNNEEMQGDAEKVYKLIDAYDRTFSDASNEIEQYRLAILILKGMGVDDEQAHSLAKANIIELMGENDDARYLTKDVNDTMIENHLDRLEENIMRLAKSVNFSDESFSGNLSGVAMKYKLMALENKCKTMERKFISALRYQYKVLCSAWAKKGICAKDDYLKVWFEFKRNLPSNILEEAQATASLKGLISERTRLSLLTFVDDTEFELEEMKKDEIEFGNKLEPLEPIGGENEELDKELDIEIEKEDEKNGVGVLNE